VQSDCMSSMQKILTLVPLGGFLLAACAFYLDRFQSNNEVKIAISKSTYDILPPTDENVVKIYHNNISPKPDGVMKIEF